MAVVNYAALLAIVHVLQFSSITFSTPAYSPIIGENPCEGAVCGRGICVPVDNTTLGFECECEPGWRQALHGLDYYPRFLPCVIPNCTLNFTCEEAPVPSDYPTPRTPIPSSSFPDPCYWGNCGGGICIRTSNFTRTCECVEGYYNLLNTTDFPCYRRCAFGEDCPTLGYNTSTSILDPDPFLQNRFNHAASLNPGAEFACFISMVAALAGVVCKYI